MRHSILAAVAIVALAPASQGAEAVKLYATNTCGYTIGDLRAAAKAGVKVIYVVAGKQVPWASDIKDMLDDGVDVRIETEEYWTSDLTSFGGKKGQATLVVASKKYWATDLTKIAKAGVNLEIRSNHLSANELKKLVEK